MRLEQLTFTRFIAAISIVIFHFGLNIFPFNLDSSSFIFNQANQGVSYFFILSGFIMIIAYGDKNEISYKEYLKRRFARIYPVYFISLVLNVYLGTSIIDLLFNITMIQAWIPGSALSINAPGWSISVEIFFYLLFPLIFNKIYSRYSTKKLIIPTLIIFFISQYFFNRLLVSSFYVCQPSSSHNLLYYFPLMHLSEFLVGNLAGLVFIKKVKTKNYDWAIIIFLIALVALLKFDFGINYHNGMLAFVFVPLIVLISANNGIITKVFNTKTFIFLGEISFGIYLLQKPVFRHVHNSLRLLEINNPTILFYVSLLTLILIAALTYIYIERPLRKKINQIQIKNT